MQITAELVGTSVGVVTLVGGIVGYVLHIKDSAQALQLELHLKEILRIDSSVKATWLQIDKLKDERANYWTRADGEKLRDGFKADMETLGNKMVKEIDKVSEQFRKDMDRAIEVFKSK